MNNRNRNEDRYGNNRDFRNSRDFQSSSSGRDYRRYEDYGVTDLARDLDDGRIDFEDHPYRFEQRQSYSNNPSSTWAPTSDEQYYKEEGHEFDRQGRFKGAGPKGYRRSDERIKEDVCDYLTQAPNVDCSDVEVSVDDGVVTLKGTVEERLMKRLAEETIEYVPGVNDVRNEIRVQSAGGRGGEKNVHLRQSQRLPKRA